MPSNKKPRSEGKAGLVEKHIKLIFILKLSYLASLHKCLNARFYRFHR